MIRFWIKGWIHDLYIAPKYHFTFYGLEFIQSWGEYTYILFALCAVSALFVALGLYYRLSITTLFLTFTYIELIDKSTYLNHYYFISMISLLMIFLPAHVYFSFDARRNKNLQGEFIPRWCLDSVKLFVVIIYFYAGLAKLNSDWLFEALPLRIWLPAKNDVFLIGPLLNEEWAAYAFSWIGCLYDLSIPFLLLNRSTRLIAYVAVIVFHGLTAILFPIGMFPYIMIVTALIFFSSRFHKIIIGKVSQWLSPGTDDSATRGDYFISSSRRSIIVSILIVFFLFQVSVPFRYLLYPGELFWTEEGYRFSWRVMLMEKAGAAEFTVISEDGRAVVVDNKEFLTTLQEKMMSTQPDMILQYAHLLRDHFSEKGFISPKVYVDSYVALNGRLGKPLIDPQIDLAAESESFSPKPWILTFNDEIKGF
jgi:hypothetical protein